MYARNRTQHGAETQSQNNGLTLGDAVAAVSAVTADEREVVAVVLHMLRHQSIRLASAQPVLHPPAPPFAQRPRARRSAGMNR